MSLLDLANQIRLLNRSVEGVASELKKELALSLLYAEIARSPVDTSKLVSNWQISVGSYENLTIEAFLLGSKGSSRHVSAGIARRIGASQLAQVRPKEDIFMSNTVEYLFEVDDRYGFLDSALTVGFYGMATTTSKFKFPLWE